MNKDTSRHMEQCPNLVRIYDLESSIDMKSILYNSLYDCKAFLMTYLSREINFDLVTADNSVALAIAFCSFVITSLLVYGAITVSRIRKIIVL